MDQLVRVAPHHLVSLNLPSVLLDQLFQRVQANQESQKYLVDLVALKVLLHLEDLVDHLSLKFQVFLYHLVDPVGLVNQLIQLVQVHRCPLLHQQAQVVQLDLNLQLVLTGPEAQHLLLVLEVQKVQKHLLVRQDL